MPATRIIILERHGPRTFRCAFWADVPTARQPFYADPATQSGFTNASAAETLALQSGAVVELVDTINFPAGLTAAQMQSALEARWAGYQADITTRNPWTQYGRLWRDDGTWVAGGIA